MLNWLPLTTIPLLTLHVYETRALISFGTEGGSTSTKAIDGLDSYVVTTECTYGLHSAVLSVQ